MTWTYSGNPASSDKDRVRFLSGDTDSTNQICSDEEIAFLLAEWSNEHYEAAASVCEYGANKAAAKADYSKSVGDLNLSTQYGKLAEMLASRAKSIRSQMDMFQGPGNARADSSALGSFYFSIGMDDNRGS